MVVSCSFLTPSKYSLLIRATLEPSWAKPIKSAVREAKAAVGIAEATIARDEQRQQFGGQDQGALQVRNGLPDSAFSHLVDTDAEASADTGFAVEDDSGEGKLSPPISNPFHLEPLARSSSGDSIIYNQRSSTETVRALPRRITRVPPPQLTPPQTTSNVVIGTTKFSPHGYNRPGVPLSWDTNETTSSLLLTSNDSDLEPNSFESSLSDPFSLPSRYLPSLTTIEKAASTKIYLETKYHSLLKTPPSRETRKHLLEKELSRLNLKEEQKQEAREAFRLSETEYLRDMRQRINVGSFKRLKVIGRGAFGVVTLVREKGSGELYAMKQLRKSDMLRKGQEGHTRAERDLLARAATSTRWTVRLAYSFQDVDNLYLVMDAMMGGGELFLSPHWRENSKLTSSNSSFRSLDALNREGHFRGIVRKILYCRDGPSDSRNSSSFGSDSSRHQTRQFPLLERRSHRD